MTGSLDLVSRQSNFSESVTHFIRGSLVVQSLLLLFAYQLLAFALFSNVAFERSHTFLVWHDASEQTYSWLTKVWQCARIGELALWDFGIFSGTSFVGELQTAPFYPLSLAYSFIARTVSPHYVDAFIILHFGVAAFFLHQFLRALGLCFFARIVGAVIFAFASPISLRAMAQPNIFFGLAYMPAATLCLLNALRSSSLANSTCWTMLAGLCLSLSILAGHVHSFIHIAVVLVVTCVIYRVQNPGSFLRPICILGGALLLSVLGGAVQIVATREYLELAYKWYADGHFTRSPHIVPFAEMAKNAIAPVAFQTAFPWSPKALGGVSLYATYSALPLVLVSVLRLRTFGTKWAWAVIFTGLFLATAGSDLTGPLLYKIPGLNLVREPDRALHIYAFGVAVAASYGFDYLLESRARFKIVLISAIALVFTAAFEVFTFDRALPVSISSAKNPYVQYQNPVLDFLKRRTQMDGLKFRFHQVPTDQIAPNAGEVMSIFNLLGYRASAPSNYFDFVNKDWNILSKNMDYLSVRYYVTPDSIKQLPKIFSNGTMNVYERSTALPIFWNLTNTGQSHVPTISSLRWRTNDVLLHIDSIEDGFLVFSQPTYPGWTAIVDGKPRKLTNWEIFTALPINKTDADVEFAYKPWWLVPIGTISVGTLLICFLVPAALFLRSRIGFGSKTRMLV